jgi:hypothetical protein
MEGLSVPAKTPQSGPPTRQQLRRSPYHETRTPGLAPIDHGRLACKAGEIIAKAVQNAARDAGRRPKGK